MYHRKLVVILALLSMLMTQAQERFSFDRKAVDEIRWSPLPEGLNDHARVTLDLNGSWKFNPAPEKDFWTQDQLPEWKTINVPGEWSMQGFDVETGVSAGYHRNFVLPQEWQGKRIKLRCEAVYSECDIWINGEKAGGHIGGFTQFELDVTDKVRKGTNYIALKVKSESLSDSLSSGSQYAVHQLGGISRPIYLMALPEVNMASFHVNTTFDKRYEDAVLHSEFLLKNESDYEQSIALHLTLKDADGHKVETIGDTIILGRIAAGRNKAIINSLEVKHPAKWDPEHPNLYYLHCSLVEDGKKTETVVRRFGFRHIEVRGNQVFVNNTPVKLRGVCRHEAHPSKGRSLTGDVWRKDVKLFKEGNVNYIRTSHYPPNEKLLEACDKLGMFVEVEGPFCWAHNTPLDSTQYFDGIIRPLVEMVIRDRSHPSILHWSVANESTKFEEWFKAAADLIKDIDPSRPRIFSQWGAKADGGYLELDNHHYPGPGGADKYRNHDRPIIFDEYCHLNAYNRFELMTDPGVRDYWGDILYNMWEKMQGSQGVLGGALWAGIDDSFFLPSGQAVGYGTWGPIDGWRRKKPEYWHMKKTYSPVKVRFIEGAQDEKVKLSIENRYLFSNLNECQLKWVNGEQKGVLSPHIEPGKTQTIVLPLKYEDMSCLSIDVYNGSEVPVDQYAFDFNRPDVVTKHTKAGKFKWSSKLNTTLVRSEQLVVDISNGDLKVFDGKGKLIVKGWPELMLVALNDKGGTQMTREVVDYTVFSPSASNRHIENISVEDESGELSIELSESYKEAAGTMQIKFSANGQMTVTYDYAMLTNALYRQWGVVFPLSKDFNRLYWKRKGLWSVYPNDHIGRNEGEAKLFYNDSQCGLAGPAQKPHWTYNMDQTTYGSNDFRSTKRNVFKARLESSNNSVELASDGTQHVHCWLNNNNINMLVAEYDNPGAERFIRGFTTHARMYDIKLIRGDHIRGTIKMNIGHGYDE